MLRFNYNIFLKDEVDNLEKKASTLNAAELRKKVADLELQRAKAKKELDESKKLQAREAELNLENQNLRKSLIAPQSPEKRKSQAPSRPSAPKPLKTWERNSLILS